MATKLFESLWLTTITCQIKFLELPAQDVKDEDFLLSLDAEDLGFQATFVRLRTTTRQSRNTWPEVQDAKLYFLEKLKAVIQQDAKYAQELRKLPADAQSLLQSYGLTF